MLSLEDFKASIKYEATHPIKCDVCGKFLPQGDTGFFGPYSVVYIQPVNIYPDGETDKYIHLECAEKDVFGPFQI